MESTHIAPEQRGVLAHALANDGYWSARAPYGEPLQSSCYWRQRGTFGCFDFLQRSQILSVPSKNRGGRREAKHQAIRRIVPHHNLRNLETFKLVPVVNRKIDDHESQPLDLAKIGRPFDEQSAPVDPGVRASEDSDPSGRQ